MVRHIVMFRFKEEADGRSKAENVAITKSMLDALPDKIDWILASTTAVGADAQAEDNCDLLLISDFASFDDLHRYIVHPDHKAVGAFMRPVRLSRSCIDVELPDK